MAQAGDTYTIALKQSHLNWGTHRYTGTRGEVLGEGYIPIPKEYAERFRILNSNAVQGDSELGKNLFHFSTSDGFKSGYLKAQGCHTAGDTLAKQFSVSGDLKALGSWFAYIDAKEGTRIQVAWLSPTEIILSAFSFATGSAVPARSSSLNPSVSIGSQPCTVKKQIDIPAVVDNCFVAATIKKTGKPTKLTINLSKYPKQAVALGKTVGEEIDLGLPGIIYVVTRIYTENE